MRKLNYKISSRATILLGRESVAKVEGAIIELVKNTYDADATLCFICFDIENDCIYILDDGIGMTEEIIENCWMLIGTDNKRENYKSEKNRIKSGEKGIGRFALDRLGNTCEMITKNKTSDKVLYWKMEWGKFEETNKSLDEIDAELEYREQTFIELIPSNILCDILKLKEDNTEISDLETGTLLKISGLRDKWNENEIKNVINSMGFLIPPKEQKDYIIIVKKILNSSDYVVIENEIAEEYDYKIFAKFDGENFYIKVDRNEFNLKEIPEEIFNREFFKKSPYTKKEFENQILFYTYSISQLMKSSDIDLINKVKEMGSFEFNYIFMKLTLQDERQEVFYYKEISKNRSIWMKQYGGIKMYRDNFFVRPYGDRNSDSFDWLNLDARRAQNPAGISHPTNRWKVRNNQGQGSLMISRVHNDCIIDKSSREGIIENEYFKLLKEITINIISIFERDRAEIAYNMKLYKDEKDEKNIVKELGKEIARKNFNKKEKNKNSKIDSSEREGNYYIIKNCKIL